MSSHARCSRYQVVPPSDDEIADIARRLENDGSEEEAALRAALEISRCRDIDLERIADSGVVEATVNVIQEKTDIGRVELALKALTNIIIVYGYLMRNSILAYGLGKRLSFVLERILRDDTMRLLATYGTVGYFLNVALGCPGFDAEFDEETRVLFSVASDFLKHCARFQALSDSDGSCLRFGAEEQGCVDCLKGLLLFTVPETRRFSQHIQDIDCSDLPHALIALMANGSNAICEMATDVFANIVKSNYDEPLDEQSDFLSTSISENQTSYKDDECLESKSCGPPEDICIESGSVKNCLSTKDVWPALQNCLYHARENNGLGKLGSFGNNVMFLFCHVVGNVAGVRTMMDSLEETSTLKDFVCCLKQYEYNKRPNKSTALQWEVATSFETVMEKCSLRDSCLILHHIAKSIYSNFVNSKVDCDRFYKPRQVSECHLC